MLDGLQCDQKTLQMVTNSLYQQNSKISIRYPPIGEIITITQRSGKVKLDLISKREYDDKHSSFCSRFPDWQKEIPRYGDLMVAFYCSGIPSHKGAEKVLLDEIKQHNVFQGKKPLWIAYDTCTLRHRFHSYIHTFIEKNKLSGSLGHVVATGVTGELKQGLGRKYKPAETNLVKREFPETNEFFNQLKLQSRLHRIGLLDINAIKKHDVYMPVESGKGDSEIVDGYSKFENDRSAEVLFFSSDSDPIDMASISGLRAKLIKYRPDLVLDYLRNHEMTLDMVNSIIYHLSIVCGFIRLRGVSIYSIWVGKDSNDWKNGSVMVVPVGNQKAPMERIHNILKTMKEAKLY